MLNESIPLPKSPGLHDSVKNPPQDPYEVQRNTWHQSHFHPNRYSLTPESSDQQTVTVEGLTSVGFSN